MTIHFSCRSTTDRKVDRLQASWLMPGRSDARWLASVADVAVTDPGAALDTDRHSYIPLDTAPRHGPNIRTGQTPERIWAAVV